MTDSSFGNQLDKHTSPCLWHRAQNPLFRAAQETFKGVTAIRECGSEGYVPAVG
jgi:hypothetical protein